jgi:hypothetical protein
VRESRAARLWTRLSCRRTGAGGALVVVAAARVAMSWM